MNLDNLKAWWRESWMLFLIIFITSFVLALARHHLGWPA